ncbi:hypothetical protein [uncultured Anaerovibrio sp.]|uniref:hypothetical protein n=1 Tax=uncultured Anaerovibrio sp. TaxID=361586 RepID=UPI0026333A03|nr:hypothetical protein [uncultured Anaerovibrio sp.]
MKKHIYLVFNGGENVAAIGVALILAQMYIDDNIRAQAKGKIKDIFGAKAPEKLDED